ncbi:hypothetical protein D3C78_1396100 [compost metagenome]
MLDQARQRPGQLPAKQQEQRQAEQQGAAEAADQHEARAGEELVGPVGGVEGDFEVAVILVLRGRGAQADGEVLFAAEQPVAQPVARLGQRGALLAGQQCAVAVADAGHAYPGVRE